jgi:hypothetical protein
MRIDSMPKVGSSAEIVLNNSNHLARNTRARAMNDGCFGKTPSVAGSKRSDLQLGCVTAAPTYC